MFGVQFEGIEGGSIKFKDLSGNFFGSVELSSADNILVWKTDGYHNYYYGVWGDPENPGWDNLWYNDGTGEDASEETIDAGTACWYLRRDSADAALTISGGVKLTPVVTTVLANDYTMFSNPYPTAIKFKNLNVANPFGSVELSSADNILVWKTDGYHNYYYGVWGDPENPGWDNLWYNDDTGEDASEEEIGVGLACWYLRRTSDATTISFTSPLAK